MANNLSSNRRSLVGSDEERLLTRGQSTDSLKAALRFFAFSGLIALTALPLQLAFRGGFSCNTGTPSLEDRQFDYLIQQAGRVERKEEEQKHSSPPLTEVARSFSDVACPGDLYRATDITTTNNETTYRIPRVIHQTSRSRCLTPRFLYETSKWKQLDGFSYFFHDDESIHRLFELSVNDFPHLRSVTESCVLTGSIQADLWRYLVLWHYGGFYADIDAVPGPQFIESLSPDDDAFFVVEPNDMLSQYFMASSPRHPLLFYSIHISLLNLLQAGERFRVGIAKTIGPATGPLALNSAFGRFAKVASHKKSSKISAGRYTGTLNRSITVVGMSQESDMVVLREVMPHEEKDKEYAMMGMMHSQQVQKERPPPSCFDIMLNATK